MVNINNRVALIHDLAGFGKCSLTVALPIISAAGLEGCCLPTAVLSTHTGGGMEGFTYHDLTKNMEGITNHWKSLNLEFSAIYTGFLGSAQQANMVNYFLDIFANKNTLVCVDPAMGDQGKLYSVFDDTMVKAMNSISKRANVLIPNITEACLLLGVPFGNGNKSEKEIKLLLHGLSERADKVIITGVDFQPNMVGVAAYDKIANQIYYKFSPKVEGHFHGTGDIFSSILVAALSSGQCLESALEISVDLVFQCILNTVKQGNPLRDGIAFEALLPKMMMRLGIIH